MLLRGLFSNSPLARKVPPLKNNAYHAVVSATLAAGSTTSETMALKDKPISMNNYMKWFWATFQQLDCQEVCTTTQQEYRENYK